MVFCNLFVLEINCRLSADGQEFFTSYDEVYDSFDAMGLQENLLRGIYAYGMANDFLFVFSCAYSILEKYSEYYLLNTLDNG